MLSSDVTPQSIAAAKLAAEAERRYVTATTGISIGEDGRIVLPQVSRAHSALACSGFGHPSGVRRDPALES